MGPIEKELRQAGEPYGLTMRGFQCCIEAAIDRGWFLSFVLTQEVDADVMSEAIEAAEALGL